MCKLPELIELIGFQTLGRSFRAALPPARRKETKRKDAGALYLKHISYLCLEAALKAPTPASFPAQPSGLAECLKTLGPGSL